MNQQKQSNYKESESLTLVIWLADHESVLRVVGLLPVALGEGLNLILLAADKFARGPIFLLFLILELERLS